MKTKGLLTKKDIEIFFEGKKYSSTSKYVSMYNNDYANNFTTKKGLSFQKIADKINEKITL
jgi:hypothetical protein